MTQNKHLNILYEFLSSFDRFLCLTTGAEVVSFKKENSANFVRRSNPTTNDGSGGTLTVDNTKADGIERTKSYETVCHLAG